jgi:hypothetical protein
VLHEECIGLVIGARTKSTVKPFNLQVQLLNKIGKERCQYCGAKNLCWLNNQSKYKTK